MSVFGNRSGKSVEKKKLEIALSLKGLEPRTIGLGSGKKGDVRPANGRVCLILLNFSSGEGPAANSPTVGRSEANMNHHVIKICFGDE